MVKIDAGHTQLQRILQRLTSETLCEKCCT